MKVLKFLFSIFMTESELGGPRYFPNYKSSEIQIDPGICILNASLPRMPSSEYSLPSVRAHPLKIMPHQWVRCSVA